MKIYEENKAIQKSWGLKLEKDVFGKIHLNAVDSESGKFITYILYFHESGKITNCLDTWHNLYIRDYNPHEHGNKFDGWGRIIIQDEE